MNSCGTQSSNHVTLDAGEITDIVFSVNEDTTNKLDFSYLDLKTFFEMLMIITTEGLKRLFGTSTGTINIEELTIDNISLVNKYLKKINVKLNIDIISRVDWNFNNSFKTYKEIDITSETKLEDLKYVFDRNNYILIWFTRV